MFRFILILFLYSNLFKFNLNTEILVSIFSMAIPIKQKEQEVICPKKKKLDF